MYDADVIVIGGGLAGLTAAHYILEKESTLVVLVLESSDEIGGRLVQAPLNIRNGSSISFFDTTGGWISKKQTHLCSLLEKLDVQLKSNNNVGRIIVELKDTYTFQRKSDILGVLSVIDKIELATFVIKIEVLCHNLIVNNCEKCSFINELTTITLEDFISKHVTSERVKIFIAYIVRLNCGTSPSDMSALFYVNFCVSTFGIQNQLFMHDNDIHAFRMKNSKRNVIEKLAKDIGEEYVLTGQHVHKLICKADYVYIATNSKLYSCRRAILAIPPKKILDIEFVPKLPKARVDVINNTFANTVTSFIVTYPTEFWTKKGFSGEIYVFDKRFSRGPIDYCGNISGFQAPALQGRIFSRRQVDSDEYPTFKFEVLQQLSDYFGEEALYPTDYFEKSWSEDPHMLCWKNYNTEYLQQVIDSFESVYFAGAETSRQWYGYMAGAVHSAIRAALEVLSDLRPSCLTLDDYLFLCPVRPLYLQRLSKCEAYPLYLVLMKWKSCSTVALLIFILLWILKRKYMDKHA